MCLISLPCVVLVKSDPPIHPKLRQISLVSQNYRHLHSAERLVKEQSKVNEKLIESNL